MAREATEIAAALIDQKGGILGGRQVQMVVEDDAGQPQTGALAATRISGNKGVGCVPRLLDHRAGLQYR